MKILFITDLYPLKSEEQSTARTLHNFVFEWIKQGHEVEVIKPNFLFNSFLRGKPYYPTGVYDYEGVKIFNVNYFTPFCFDIKKKIPKEFNLENFAKNFDIIIAHMPSGIIFANKLIKKLSSESNIYPPLVCGVHVSDIEVLTKPIYGFYFRNQLKEAYHGAKKIACRSFVLQKKFVEIFPELAEKTFVAASGIDEKIIVERKFSQELPLKVLTCANLIKRKNIDKLISAVNDNFELTVIGDGKEFKKLKKIGRSNVKFLGRLSGENVLEQMTKSDIFVLPSVKETFGMVYLEAMASGCIVVCTKNDGIDGIIKDGGNGFLCEPTVEGIKEVLLKIKDNKNLDEIIKNSLSTIKEYTQEKCAKYYLDNI